MPIDIHKNDLKLISPINGNKITERRPALTWEEYEDAHVYFLHLGGDSAGNRDQKFELDTSKPGARPTTDLPNGKYYWIVSADDKNFKKIADSSRETGTFEVVDELPQPKRKK